LANKPELTFLFHQPQFIFRNPGDNVVPFESERAAIYFLKNGNSLVSLDRAPFGSFRLTEGASETELSRLLEKIESWAKVHNVSHLMIRSYPDAYHPAHNALIKNALHRSGFNVKYDDISQLISIEKAGMNLDTHKRRRRRKADDSDFTFRLLPLSFLAEAYSLVVESRENKNYPVTMTLKDLEATFERFPHEYLLFGVFDKNKMVATSVSIKVNSEIMYSFYIGDALAYRSYSPVTTLVDGIYRYCQTHQFKILDLGLSTDKGVMNEGLYTFKKTFGTFDSHKLTYLKQL
jgi:hypothetical protein